MDGISDLIVRIKNASDARKELVTIPHSKMKAAILEVLEREGYIKGITKKGKKIHKSIEVGLVYDEYGPRVKGVERVSHLSKRIYGGVKDLKTVKQGHGMLILTTPKGIMTDAQARKEKVGGELLFKIW
ncbi:MAG: ribosomal protein small subunit ribosomal protein [Candidatus Paceibacter sp.]|jgi:small subunit ribosomal protein S8|nr:ribosomal protein small subunit ribosomal protein [Candidatus Paceibacter sp.]